MKGQISSVLAAFSLALAFAAFPAEAENPCSGVDRALTKERSSALAPAVAKQLGAKRAEISQAFRYGGWSILYVSTGEADDAYVFYSADPLRNHYVTLWGGVAVESEEQQILDWTLRNAPHIPRPLARCFAWHVTQER